MKCVECEYNRLVLEHNVNVCSLNEFRGYEDNIDCPNWCPLLGLTKVIKDHCHFYIDNDYDETKNTNKEQFTYYVTLKERELFSLIKDITLNIGKEPFDTHIKQLLEGTYSRR